MEVLTERAVPYMVQKVKIKVLVSFIYFLTIKPVGVDTLESSGWVCGCSVLDNPCSSPLAIGISERLDATLSDFYCDNNNNNNNIICHCYAWTYQGFSNIPRYQGLHDMPEQITVSSCKLPNTCLHLGLGSEDLKSQRFWPLLQCPESHFQKSILRQFWH